MPLNINIQQILLHLFNFVLLFAILYFLLYKPVKEFMDKRAASVRACRDEAEAALREAEAMKAEYTAHLAAFEEERRAARAQAEADAAEAVKKKLADAEVKAEAILTDARRKAEVERKKLLDESKNDIAALAEEMAERVVTKNLNDAFEQFLESAERGDGNA